MFDWIESLTPATNLSDPVLVAYVLFDIFLIVILARLLGNVLTRIGQPRVVGEILAGILLGPTLLGETLSQVIAPMEVRGTLSAIATLALILFMFLAGAEFDGRRVSGRLGQAGLLGVLSVAIPAVSGFPVAAAMYSDRYVEAGVAYLPFALLVGAALSVTAFPIMAHILMEQGTFDSPLGSLAVASAAFISIFMFLYIAFAAAMATGSMSGFLLNLGLLLVFGLVSWFGTRPFLARVLPPMFQNGSLSGTGVALVFGGMVLYGLITHLLNINALVGGFVWGIILPGDSSMRKYLANKVRDVALILLLPVFMALAGFSTDLKLISPKTFPALLLMLIAAVGGKFLAAIPVRAFGLSWGDAGTLGALFNTRGLLILVVGLIGLDLEIITTLTFSIFVVIALATNLMTLPLLNYFSKYSE